MFIFAGLVRRGSAVIPDIQRQWCGDAKLDHCQWGVANGGQSIWKVVVTAIWSSGAYRSLLD